MNSNTMQEIYPGYISLDDCTENGTYLCAIFTSTGIGCTTEVVMELEDGVWSTDEEPDGIGIFDTDFWDTDRYHTVCKKVEA